MGAPTRGRKPTDEAVAANAPWLPIQISDRAASLLKAMQRGECPPDGQQWVLRWIIEEVCATYDLAYRPGANDRDTNIALGRQFAGQQIVKHLNVNLNRIRPEKPSEGENNNAN